MIDIAIVLIYSITSIIWILKKIHFEGLSFQTNIKVIILKVIISLIFPTSIYIFFLLLPCLYYDYFRKHLYRREWNYFLDFDYERLNIIVRHSTPQMLERIYPAIEKRKFDTKLVVVGCSIFMIMGVLTCFLRDKFCWKRINSIPTSQNRQASMQEKKDTISKSKTTPAINIFNITSSKEPS